MAWHKFVNSTTAYGNEVHENFQLCGSGNLLPCKISDTMSYTTGVYNLGSESYKWNNLYCNNLNISSSKHINILNGYTTTLIDDISSSNRYLLKYELQSITTNAFYSFLMVIKIEWDSSTKSSSGKGRWSIFVANTHTNNANRFIMCNNIISRGYYNVSIIHINGLWKTSRNLLKVTAWSYTVTTWNGITEGSTYYSGSENYLFIEFDRNTLDFSVATITNIVTQFTRSYC